MGASGRPEGIEGHFTNDAFFGRVGVLMGVIGIDGSIEQILADFECPTDIPFGKVMAPVMARATWRQGEWGKLGLVPYGKIELDPTSKVLHYGQEIFEGLKGFKNHRGEIFLFRPEDNARRFDASARRMAMPELPSDYFMEAVCEVTWQCKNFVPSQPGDSLYIRPFMFASEGHLGLDSGKGFEFLVIASPSQAFFSKNVISVKIERQAVRAISGGVGCAKTGGNYAASLLSMIEARKEGCQQVLWLDGEKRCHIEELSGMNFFAVYGDTLKTPRLTDTILNGITRKSLLELSRHLGYRVEEVEMPVDDLLGDIDRGTCTEMFACGTAVILAFHRIPAGWRNLAHSSKSNSHSGSQTQGIPFEIAAGDGGMTPSGGGFRSPGSNSWNAVALWKDCDIFPRPLPRGKIISLFAKKAHGVCHGLLKKTYEGKALESVNSPEIPGTPLVVGNRVHGILHAVGFIVADTVAGQYFCGVGVEDVHASCDQLQSLERL